MPWQSTDPVNERLKFIAAHQSRAYTMSELCRRYGISRETGYTWVDRYRTDGVAGLEDRSHAPKQCPHSIDPGVAELLVSARESHPHWGPRKLLAWLAARHPEARLPAASTAGELLKREGLVRARRKRQAIPPRARIPLNATAPNQVWSADFKGEFRTGDGIQCYPLTISDAYSRFLLCCKGLSSVKTVGAMAGFTEAFKEYGLPDAIRTDNGYPFAKATPFGLTRLNLWWTKLGIAHDRIQPGRPEQNGRHERMHRTLKAETTRPPGQDLEEQQFLFDAFRGGYDLERPHEALGQATPASVYHPSDRALPEHLPDPIYPGHCEIRRVGVNGNIGIWGHQLFLSEVLAGERVALNEVDDGVWSIFIYQRLLGRLDARTLRVSG